MKAFEFAKAHWPWFVGVGVPLLLTLIASVVNRFGDPDGDPATPPPKWVRALQVLADLLAWVPRPGQSGLLGPVNLPGVPSSKAPPSGTDAALVLVMAGSAVVALCSGCAGFRAPTYSTLTAAVNASYEARAMLPDACEKVQRKAVEDAKTRDEATKATKAIRKRCSATLTALDATVQTAKTARDMVASDALKDPSSVAKWAIAALNAYSNVKGLLDILGVKMPSLAGGQ